jgi:streptogramin lyase
MTLIDGETAEVAARVDVGEAAPGLVAAQAGPVGYAVDGARGTVARVDPRTFVAGPMVAVIEDASGNVAAHATDDAVYVLDEDRGRVAVVDADDLQAKGGVGDSMAEKVGSSVVDGEGRLWLLGASSGDLVWFDGPERRDRPTVVDDPGSAELVVVHGAPAVVDRAARRVNRVGGSGGFTREACVEMDPADDSLRFGGSFGDDRVYVVSGRPA